MPLRDSLDTAALVAGGQGFGLAGRDWPERRMNKDELIADLRGQVTTLARLLEMALNNRNAEDAPPEVQRSAAAERQWRYRQRKGPDNEPLRIALRERDGDGCRYCGDSPDETLAIDHVIPLARNGSNSLSNLVLACKPCNSRKRDSLPEEIGMTLRPVASQTLRTEASRGGLIGGGVPGTSGEDVLDDEEKTGTPATGKGSRGKPNVTKVTPGDGMDMARAEADASSHGLSNESFKAELQRFTDYWDSAGWRRKNGPVKDRNATFRTWLASPFRTCREGATGAAGRPKNAPDYSGIEEWNRKQDQLEASR